MKDSVLFTLSDKFLESLKQLSAARAKLNTTNEQLNKIKRKEAKSGIKLKVHPPNIEKITERFYLNNDDIIPIVHKVYFSYNHKILVIIINLFYSSNCEYLNEHYLNKSALRERINYTKEKKESIIETFYKHSLFFIGPCYFVLTLKSFECLLAFDSAKSIHIFVDDIMSSIIYPVRRKVNVPDFEKLKSKIKTFLVTFDVNQIVKIDKDHAFIPFCEIEFFILNLNNIYRYSKRVFEYLLPFYHRTNS